MPIPRLPADVDAEVLAAALTDHGCAIVERLAPAELCDRVAAELAPWIERTPMGGDDFSGRSTRRTGALLARSPGSVELIAHPVVLGAVERVLGQGDARFQLHLTQAISIGPGSPAQQLHRDQWCFDLHPFPVDLDVDYREESGERQAGLEARLRLQQMIRKGGRQAYAQYEAMAAERLIELTLQPDAGPQVLDVPAGAESQSLTGDDQDADIWVGVGMAHCRNELVEHLRAGDGVTDVRTGQRQGGDATLGGVCDVFHRLGGGFDEGPGLLGVDRSGGHVVPLQRGSGDHAGCGFEQPGDVLDP